MTTSTSKSCTKCGVVHPATREFFGSTPKGNLRGACRTCVRKKNKQYATDNPESVRRRAVDRHQRVEGFKPTDEMKQSLFHQQSGCCGLCGEAMDEASVLDPSVLQVEHLTPAVRGGTNDEANLVLAHRKCNQEKAGKTMNEYLAWRQKVGLPMPQLP